MRKLLLLLLLAASCYSCHTTRRSVVTTSDTLVRLRRVEVPYDTTIQIAGHMVSAVGQVVVVNGQAQMPEQTITAGRLSAKVSVVDGVLKVTAQVDDSAIAVHGITTTVVSDTTIHEKKVITITRERSWWGRIMHALGNGVAIIVAVAAILCIYIFLPGIRKWLS